MLTKEENAQSSEGHLSLDEIRRMSVTEDGISLHILRFMNMLLAPKCYCQLIRSKRKEDKIKDVWDVYGEFLPNNC
ncbi:hypothetical protein DAPPUDRAFT_244677 [Daphnia pulex]|uniref:Uncharacterized protein n=1 Tax=Daphnia pulex TaxID=6669 RepID=E9GLI7_DAPPU|nr:hypothetical protein DAPPUDRAFT_244677 [Daphnia pulex]|eukprot:EFX79688.1 hypothetical protein DAPPUDRAFT_244677 [Daphnia pulex]